MALYTDLYFYQNQYNNGRCNNEGVISRFTYYATKATSFIKMYTWDNVDENDIPGCVKMCCCELMDMMDAAHQQASEIDANVTSESVGGWSRSFSSASDREQQLQSSMKNTVYSWLSGTGLLYRGVY